MKENSIPYSRRGIPMFEMNYEPIFVMNEPEGIYTPPRRPKLKGYKKAIKKTKYKKFRSYGRK